MYMKGLCVETYFVKYVDEFGEVKSDYNNPTSAKYGDFLRVESIKIFNLGNETLEPFKINLKISPKQGYSDKPQGFGEFSLNVKENLIPNSELIITRNFVNHYDYYLNEELIKTDTTFYDIELNELGEWETKMDIQAMSYTIFINNRYHGYLFVVVSPFEAESSSMENMMLRLALTTLIFLAGLTLIQISLEILRNPIKILIKKS